MSKSFLQYYMNNFQLLGDVTISCWTSFCRSLTQLQCGECCNGYQLPWWPGLMVAMVICIPHFDTDCLWDWWHWNLQQCWDVSLSAVAVLHRYSQPWKRDICQIHCFSFCNSTVFLFLKFVFFFCTHSLHTNFLLCVTMVTCSSLRLL